MKRYLFIIILLIVGCTSRLMIDYYGNSIYIAEDGVILKDLERDETDADIFYLKFWEHPRNPILVKKGLRKSLHKIMNDFGYIGYHVISDDYIVTAWTAYFLYEVRFSKTEQDFEKWDRYLKN